MNDTYENIVKWIWALPIMLTANNKSKAIRVFGILITIPYMMVAIVITGIPVLLIISVLLLIDICKNA